ncbi:DUF6688 domain-containing protein [Cohnella thailandensis]|uniref:Uncharacterized protein n=1 Tax=Cohnella thailandensis TaxID=557557 RepID=A0A841SZL7_9BACL|nr:DUF6688 family protein [Cohnella thailandensis]MBB6635077.1 hypothetical protein [Cohnella thailandensis]MBP1977860.1 ABC-type sugar transport system permease subunit [Cohnella thailandensis]
MTGFNALYFLFFLLVLAFIIWSVFDFVRQPGEGEQGEGLTGARFFDGVVLSIFLFMMIFGFVFDHKYGVPGGEPLQVFEQTGAKPYNYASLSHKHSAVLVADWLLGFIAYWLLRVYHRRLSPIVYACSNALLAINVVLAVVYAVHTGFSDYDIFTVLPLQLGSLTFGLLYLAQLKRSLDIWKMLRREDKEEELPAWQRPLHRFMLRGWSGVSLWTFLMFPVQLVISLVLGLFGQRPDGIVRAFLDTSGYHLSKLPAPPPEMLPGDGHYLCTVAARGHSRVVKPLRAGIRHGEAIPVNRQLLIANAFENVLEQYAPTFHRKVRRLYDKYGFPISRHIRTKVAADIVYLAMKPLEWFFLLVLYTVDAKPENRIHVQYSGFKEKGRTRR